MVDFSVDDDGEWTMVDGDFVIVGALDKPGSAAELEASKLEEIRQAVRDEVRLHKGEVQFDVDAGVDRELVHAAGASVQAVAGEFRDVIQGVPGIVSVESVSADYDASTRTLAIAYDAVASTSDLDRRARLQDSVTLEGV